MFTGLQGRTFHTTGFFVFMKLTNTNRDQNTLSGCRIFYMRIVTDVQNGEANSSFYETLFERCPNTMFD